MRSLIGQKGLKPLLGLCEVSLQRLDRCIRIARAEGLQQLQVRVVRVGRADCGQAVCCRINRPHARPQPPDQPTVTDSLEKLAPVL